MHNKKQSKKESLIEQAVKTTIQLLYNKGLFDNYDNVDELKKKILRTETRRPILEKLNDDHVIQ